ncbi:methyl-accepting chemotaxis protein [Paucibacter sp. TC2R-5]|uniref:methyl-accepting chemotaxis protein n=1 Tax=Paucibacter sp. TC2R-5 TaxID=2893555 RepID=UPI0029620189|nr:methyl-accepting chemotaxis protein [Paucibacter sp. TC2R-5]
MKLSLKLPLAFVAVLALMLMAALYGIFSVNHSLDSFTQTVQSSHGRQRTLSELTVGFKVQVQEWKNTLLRGKDPQQLDKHWAAFQKQERLVSERTAKLLRELPAGASKDLLAKFALAHQAMGDSYRLGYGAFTAADFEPSAGDTAVKGMDRAPTQLLEELDAQFSVQGERAAQLVADQSERAIGLSLLMMGLASACGIAAGLWLSRHIAKQLGGDPLEAANLAQSVAAGDFAQRIKLNSGDSASLMAQLVGMMGSLSSVVHSVRQNSESVASASAQIAQGNMDLSQRTEQQATALEGTALSIKVLGSAVEKNADHAREANRLAQGASEVAVRGGDVVGQVVDTMKGINDSSKQIADIIGVIDGIAFQTNILALNAAVEAARAGEQGRGFAVVAAEVRSLAQRSAEAAKQIKTLIGASVERVEQGSHLVNQAGSTMNEIVDAIKHVSDIMGEISEASRAQSAGVLQVGQAFNLMDQATQQNSALVEQSTAAAESLRVQAQALVQSVAVFKLASHSH